ncbi:fungal hydrophobin-domain-containing protein [Infundibulicybe gibba]|nr:fungal hydrophobin-domain-containing protein [Infundibulicybe gibba]
MANFLSYMYLLSCENIGCVLRCIPVAGKLQCCNVNKAGSVVVELVSRGRPKKIDRRQSLCPLWSIIFVFLKVTVRVPHASGNSMRARSFLLTKTNQLNIASQSCIKSLSQNMFSRISFVTVSALAILATAMPNNPPATTTVTVTTPAPTSIPASQCNVDGLQCCNSLQAGNSGAVSKLLGLLGVVLDDVTALVGVTCTPITIVGITGGACSAQPVCCTNNNFHGLIAIGCVPINIGL